MRKLSSPNLSTIIIPARALLGSQRDCPPKDERGGESTRFNRVYRFGARNRFHRRNPSRAQYWQRRRRCRLERDLSLDRGFGEVKSIFSRFSRSFDPLKTFMEQVDLVFVSCLCETARTSRSQKATVSTTTSPTTSAPRSPAASSTIR